MKFVVFTNAPLLWQQDQWVGYAPYVREMNIWMKYADQVTYICPVWKENDGMVLLPLASDTPVEVSAIPDFNFTTAPQALRSLVAMPFIIFRILWGMWQADHIHLRTPCNVGLISCMLQVFFPFTPKTAKYAGNWDPGSRQPWTYRLQQYILNNTWLSRKMKVLVYGEWQGTSSNIVPFFTATYHDYEKTHVVKPDFSSGIRLIYVGELASGKQPELSCRVAGKLKERGHHVHLNMYGKGEMQDVVNGCIASEKLEDVVTLHGSQPSEVVKKAYQRAHFLVFISKSEGWPKVVAESMFWGALPITTAVSCVPQMVNFGSRGTLVEADVDQIADGIEQWLHKPGAYAQASEEAMAWSRQYTLERFDREISVLLGRPAVEKASITPSL